MLPPKVWMGLSGAVGVASNIAACRIDATQRGIVPALLLRRNRAKRAIRAQNGPKRPVFGAQEVSVR